MTDAKKPRHFDNWLKAYMDYTLDSEAPNSFHFWSGVFVLAGALRRRVWIDMRKFQWTPNFYIILVGPPGVVTKSTSLGIGTRLLNKIPDIHFGPESMTWQGLAEAFSKATEFVKYVGPDGKDALSGMSALNISIGELGTFLTMEDDKLLSFLIRMWEGQEDKFQHQTKTSGNVEVLNPWLNFIAGTTPSWMEANFPKYMIGGGLTSRIIFVYGEKKRKLVAYPDEVIQSDAYKNLEKNLVEDLLAISKLSGPYHLSSGARDWGHRWYASHHSGDRPGHLSSERYGGYLARKQTHIHKIAIVLAAARSDKLIIEKEHLEEAEKVITSIEPDMIRVFESIGVVDEAKHIAEIIAFVRHSPDGFMTVDDLWSMCVQIMPLKLFEDAVRAAVRGRMLKVEQKVIDGGFLIEGLTLANSTRPTIQ